MCWREQFLTLCSSLITYTGKEFVYIIIFSLTASPKAAMIQALPASPPSPPPCSPVKRAPGAGARKDALLLPPGQLRPHTKPSSACKSLCKLLRAENASAGLSRKTPSLGFASYLRRGASPEPLSTLPGSRDHQQHAAPSRTGPASALRVKLMRNPSLGAAPRRHRGPAGR